MTTSVKNKQSSTSTTKTDIQTGSNGDNNAKNDITPASETLDSNNQNDSAQKVRLPVVATRLLCDEIARAMNAIGYFHLSQSQHDGEGNFYTVGRDENIIRLTVDYDYYATQVARQDLPRMEQKFAMLTAEKARTLKNIDAKNGSKEANEERLEMIECELEIVSASIDRCKELLGNIRSNTIEFDLLRGFEFEVSN